VTAAAWCFFVEGHSFGLSIIEALDTRYVMGLDRELARCVSWLNTNLDATLMETCRCSRRRFAW
jgi:hypothetical protein